MIKYALIDDAAISLGGTSLTLDAITEPFKHECEIISSKISAEPTYNSNIPKSG